MRTALRNAMRMTMLMAALLPVACSQKVVMQMSLPDPLIEPLPYTAGLRYPASLTEYTYVEDLPDDATWRFELGAANRELFDKILGAMFANTVHLAADTASDPAVDLIIEPEIEALEFSLPRQSRSNQYAVWIRYNLGVYRPDGTLLTRWPVSAYGQADSRQFKGSQSMAIAVERAMRDAAATIATGFAGQPPVRQLLESKDDGESDKAEANDEQHATDGTP